MDSELSDLNEKKNNPRVYARAPSSTFELPAVEKVMISSLVDPRPIPHRPHTDPTPHSHCPRPRPH